MISDKIWTDPPADIQLSNRNKEKRDKYIHKVINYKYVEAQTTFNRNICDFIIDKIVKLSKSKLFTSLIYTDTDVQLLSVSFFNNAYFANVDIKHIITSHDVCILRTPNKCIIPIAFNKCVFVLTLEGKTTPYRERHLALISPLLKMLYGELIKNYQKELTVDGLKVIKTIISNTFEISALFNSDMKVLCYSNAFRKEIFNITETHINTGYNLRQLSETNSNISTIINSIDATFKYGKRELVHIMSRNYKNVANNITTEIYSASYNILTINGVEYVCIFAKNITENRNLEEEIDQLQVKCKLLNDNLHDALTHRDEYLSRISHELRTPLNTIVGFAQILQYDAINSKIINLDNIENIIKGGDILLNLINEVLDISNINSDNFKISMADVYSTDCILSSIELLRPLMETKHLTLVFDHDTNGYILWTDANRYKQVLINILSNAIKYNKYNGNIKITYNVETDDSEIYHLITTICDTGCGIKSDVMNRLYVPFDRLGMEETNIEGTGLGLAVTKSIVEKLGGQINITSIYGESTSVSLKMPLKLKDSNHNIKIDIQRRFSIRSALILYIESNISHYRIMEEMFRYIDRSRIINVSDNNIGIELIKANIPELIILDLDESGDNKNEIIVYISESNDEHIKKIPIIIYTESMSEEKKNMLLTIPNIKNIFIKDHVNAELMKISIAHVWGSQSEPHTSLTRMPE